MPDELEFMGFFTEYIRERLTKIMCGDCADEIITGANMYAETELMALREKQTTEG